MNSSNEWYRNWFDEYYLILYQKRNIEEARRFLGTIAGLLTAPQNPLVLDLACGAGRHSHLMHRELGWKVVGIDLSSVLLSHAMKHITLQHHDAKGAESRTSENNLSDHRNLQNGNPQFLRGDIRILPFPSGIFDLEFSLFTSFGYFQTDREHLETLKEFNRVLKPDGQLILDLFNPQTVIETLVPEETVERDGLIFQCERFVDDETKRIGKNIHILNAMNNESLKEITESVRYFHLDEITSMLNDSGFQVHHIFGNYNGSDFNENSSERMILWVKMRS